jgi:UDP-glucose 4-epimerase
MSRAFVTGGAGFIGSNLVDRLLERGDSVVVYDNFSTGFESFLSTARQSKKFTLIRGDILDLPALTAAMQGCDFVYHLSANADVRFGTDHPRRDLEQNTIGTFNVLEGMRNNGIRKIAFSSTGSVYGECDVIPTPENAPFPGQTSLYGASKLAGEGLIQSYCVGFDFQCWIFRFVSILGERYTHGHVFDFYKSLLADASTIRVLGNGRQRKSYLYIQDCIDAIFCATERATDAVNIFNLGTNEYCDVNQSLGWICDQLGVKPEVAYTGGERGWIGDNPFIFLDAAKMRSLGWTPKLTIQQAVLKTLGYLQQNKELLVRK